MSTAGIAGPVSGWVVNPRRQEKTVPHSHAGTEQQFNVRV